jgi:hypothetical protein
MKLKPIYQPEGSNLCGQTCVAMIVGRTLEAVIMVFGHRHATKTRELVSALREYGFRCEDRLTRKRKGLPFPKLCIVKVLWHAAGSKRLQSHWVMYWDGEFYDPAECEAWKKGKMSSFLEIKGTPWTR